MPMKGETMPDIDLRCHQCGKLYHGHRSRKFCPDCSSSRARLQSINRNAEQRGRLRAAARSACLLWRRIKDGKPTKPNQFAEAMMALENEV